MGLLPKQQALNCRSVLPAHPPGFLSCPSLPFLPLPSPFLPSLLSPFALLPLFCYEWEQGQTERRHFLSVHVLVQTVPHLQSSPHLPSSNCGCLFIGEVLCLEVAGDMDAWHLKMALLLMGRDSGLGNLGPEFKNKLRAYGRRILAPEWEFFVQRFF